MRKVLRALKSVYDFFSGDAVMLAGTVAAFAAAFVLVRTGESRAGSGIGSGSGFGGIEAARSLRAMVFLQLVQVTGSSVNSVPSASKRPPQVEMYQLTGSPLTFLCSS